jgi:hypothetical protein
MTDVLVPQAPVQTPARPQRDPLTPGMLEALRQTKPWARFLSIMGFVGAGFMLIASIGMGAFGAFQFFNEAPTEGATLMGMALLYVFLSIFYVPPSVYLFRYASAIGTALAAPSKSAAVEKALQHQKSFWKFVGIMTLVAMLLWIPAIALITISNLFLSTTTPEKASILSILTPAEKEKRTIADMRAIASAVEAYGVDYNRYPEADSIDELATLLEPQYIATLPRVDAWGTPYRYQSTDCFPKGGCQRYLIGSAANDKVFEPTPLTDWKHGQGETGSWDTDIVYSNGAFVRFREAARTRDRN